MTVDLQAEGLRAVDALLRLWDDAHFADAPETRNPSGIFAAPAYARPSPRPPPLPRGSVVRLSVSGAHGGGIRSVNPLGATAEEGDDDDGGAAAATELGVEDTQKPNVQKDPTNAAEFAPPASDGNGGGSAGSRQLGAGGRGAWRYFTSAKGVDADGGRAQFYTVWRTPTVTEPIPRAVAGVWFVYERREATKRRSTRPSIEEQLSGKSGSLDGGDRQDTGPETEEDAGEAAVAVAEIRSTESITAPSSSSSSSTASASESGHDEDDYDDTEDDEDLLGTLTYRFEHSRISETVAVPTDLGRLADYLPRQLTESGEALRLTNPALRVPELVESALLVACAIDRGKMLGKRETSDAGNGGGRDDENDDDFGSDDGGGGVAAQNAESATGAAPHHNDDDGDASWIDRDDSLPAELRARLHRLCAAPGGRVGNGVPRAVLLDLARAEPAPDLPADRVLGRRRLRPQDLATVPPHLAARCVLAAAAAAGAVAGTAAKTAAGTTKKAVDRAAGEEGGPVTPRPASGPRRPQVAEPRASFVDGAGVVAAAAQGETDATTARPSTTGGAARASSAARTSSAAKASSAAVVSPAEVPSDSLPRLSSSLARGDDGDGSGQDEALASVATAGRDSVGAGVAVSSRGSVAAKASRDSEAGSVEDQVASIEAASEEAMETVVEPASESDVVTGIEDGQTKDVEDGHEHEIDSQGQAADEEPPAVEETRTSSLAEGMNEVEQTSDVVALGSLEGMSNRDDTVPSGTNDPEDVDDAQGDEDGLDSSVPI
ncbi:hypothetical protein HK405_007688 [Cladochytrium tenue]|nr:hypothetical protein HK405_007688 [Cladochytrium tenue]